METQMIEIVLQLQTCDILYILKLVICPSLPTFNLSAYLFEIDWKGFSETACLFIPDDIWNEDKHLNFNVSQTMRT